MKKKLLALGLALSLGLTLGGSAGVFADDGDLGDKLVLYSSMTEFDLEALITCFNEVYPDIEVEVVSGSVGEFTSRIAAEADPAGRRHLGRALRFRRRYLQGAV